MLFAQWDIGLGPQDWFLGRDATNAYIVLDLAFFGNSTLSSHHHSLKMPFLKAGIHTLHYFDSHPAGPPTPTGLTFIFIHGLGSSQNYYFPVIPALSDHRCLLIDTYGSGRSPYTNDPVSIPSIAQDVIGALDVLNVSKAVVVGHSMGGLVVMELGARHSDRIAGVVAIGPTHPSETLVSVMSKRADTVSEGMYLPSSSAIGFTELSVLKVPFGVSSWNGTHGQHHSLRSGRLPQHTATKGIHSGAAAWPGSQGVRSTL